MTTPATQAPTKEIAVLGTEDFTLGFQLAGIRRAVHAETSDEFAARAEEILSAPQGIGILVVDPKDMDGVNPHLRKKLMDSIDPVVVPLGGGAGDLREKVKRAIGIDLYKE